MQAKGREETRGCVACREWYDARSQEARARAERRELQARRVRAIDDALAWLDARAETIDTLRGLRDEIAAELARTRVER